MLGCESNFKENAELVVTIALGKRYMSDIVFLLLLSLPFVKIFLLPFLKSWFTWYIFIVCWKSCVLQNMWNIYTFIHKYMQIFLHREMRKKKSECVLQKQRESASLAYGMETAVTFYPEVWKNCLPPVINVSADCFLWMNA